MHLGFVVLLIRTVCICTQSREYTLSMMLWCREDLRCAPVAELLQAAMEHGYNAALRIDNTNADAWVGMGEAHLQLGRLHAAGG